MQQPGSKLRSQESDGQCCHLLDIYNYPISMTMIPRLIVHTFLFLHVFYLLFLPFSIIFIECYIFAFLPYYTLSYLTLAYNLCCIILTDTHHVRLDPLSILGASLINIFPCLIGANEADRLYGRMVTDEIHRCVEKILHHRQWLKMKKNVLRCIAKSTIQILLKIRLDISH